MATELNTVNPQRCKVAGQLKTGRFYEMAGWLSQSEARSLASKLAKDARIETVDIITQEKTRGRWKRNGRIAYKPQNSIASTP
ncbi:MAG: hypothetical protein P4L87_03405 [Formivibrio sp.]|nr:hypothetical protein [Formivibrio sp.]